MSDIDPELIAKVADAIDVRRHDFRVDTDTWRPHCICGWSAEESHDVAAYDRHLAVAVLEAAAPLLAAKAWEQGYRAANMEWEHLYDGHTVEPEDLNGLCIECGQGNPYKRNEER